ncbi:MAG TPA: MFS transporter [Chloroflexota bacterium]|nr:MFS transporter [Chloroflexota bacterium]
MTQTPQGLSLDEPVSARTRLWTRGFLLLCTSTVLCYFANYLVGVVLPLYVQDIGGDPIIIGLVFTSFSATSFVLRPLIGHLSDVWSVRGTIAIGAGLLGGLPFALVFPSLWVSFFANAIRGIGWGAFSSGSSTGVALLAPPGRRGEASGHYSIAGTASQAFAPAIGLWLLQLTGSFSVVFFLGGICGLAALALLLTQVPRIGAGRTTFLGAFRWAKGGIGLSTFVEPRVLLASVILVCLTLTSPVTFAFVPVYARAIDVENISVYFIAAGVTSITARFVCGRYLDRGSRGQWILAGYWLLAVAFVVFTQARDLNGFIIAAVFSAVGTSLAQPALMALAMDRAAAGRMGKAMATYSMFYRVGEGLGAPLAGVLIVRFGFTGMYLGALAIILIGVVLVTANWGTLGHQTAATPH